MTLLELFQEYVVSWTSTQKTAPTTVVGVTGKLARSLVQLKAAYNEIQVSRSDWAFLNKSATVNTVADTVEVTPATDFKTLECNPMTGIVPSIYLAATGVSDENHLAVLPYPKFERAYGIGSHTCLLYTSPSPRDS